MTGGSKREGKARRKKLAGEGESNFKGRRNHPSLHYHQEPQLPRRSRRVRKEPKMNEKMVLTKQEVCRLYDEGKKTLAEIGQVAGVTRARIGQLMDEWGHPRRRSGPPRKDKFTDLDSFTLSIVKKLVDRPRASC